MPCGIFLAGTTVTWRGGFSLFSCLAACCAAIMMLLLLGSRMTRCEGSLRTASASSATLGFMLWPPSTMPLAPKLRKISAKPVPGRHGDEADMCLVEVNVDCGRLVGGVDALEDACHLVFGGHVVHILDDDVGEKAGGHAVGERHAGVKDVDVHLDQVFVALDERAVAHGGDVGGDDVHRLVRLFDQELDVEAPLDGGQGAVALALAALLEAEVFGFFLGLDFTAGAPAGR